MTCRQVISFMAAQRRHTVSGRAGALAPGTRRRRTVVRLHGDLHVGLRHAVILALSSEGCGQGQRVRSLR